MTLPQQRLIERVRRLCRDDERLVAALTYGSFLKAKEFFKDLDTEFGA